MIWFWGHSAYKNETRSSVGPNSCTIHRPLWESQHPIHSLVSGTKRIRYILHIYIYAKEEKSHKATNLAGAGGVNDARSRIPFDTHQALWIVWPGMILLSLLGRIGRVLGSMMTLGLPPLPKCIGGTWPAVDARQIRCLENGDIPACQLSGDGGWIVKS
jgi:hypothetical protein